jgi:phage repressor protein C with HTH and peptisase S24 domain
MKLNERIRQLIKNKQITAYEVSKQTGISESTLSRILNGNTEKLGFKNASLLANYFNIELEWLRFGEGEMLKKTEKNDKITHVATQSTEGIPLIPINAMAGFGTGMQTILEFECERYVVPLFRGAQFLIDVKGSSMQPKYNSGDIVACKKLPLTDIFFQWNKVYVLDTEQGALIKRICKGKDGEHITLVSDNKKYEPFELHLSQVNSIALVIGVIRAE